MRKLFLIGIGAGDPEQLTVQAITAMNTVDAFFVLDKGDHAAELVHLRKQIVERYVTGARTAWSRCRTHREIAPRRRIARQSRTGIPSGPTSTRTSSVTSWDLTSAAPSWSGATHPYMTARCGSSLRSCRRNRRVRL